MLYIHEGGEPNVASAGGRGTYVTYDRGRGT